MAIQKFNKEEPRYKVGDRVIIAESNIEGICGVNLRGKNVVGTISNITNIGSDYPYWVTCDEYPGGLYCNVKCLAYEFKNEKIVITHDGKTTTATLYNGDTKVTTTARCAPEDDFEFRIGAEIAMARLVDKLVYAKFNVVRVVFREGERAYSYKTRQQAAKVGMEIVVPVGRNNKELNATVVEIIPGAEYEGEYAISAMKEIDIVEVPKYYSGNVVCTHNGYCPTDLTVGKIYTFVDGNCKNNLGGMILSSPAKNLDDLNRRATFKFIEIVE